MKSKYALTILIISLVLLPLAFGLGLVFGGDGGGTTVTRSLFAATVAVEVIALIRVLAARKMFSRADPMHLTWSLIAAFLTVRLLGEARLLTLTFNLIPTYTQGSSKWLFYYVVGGRYLYTGGDLLFVASLITTIQAYKATALQFKVVGRDFFYIAVLWTIPFLTYAYRDNLALGGIVTSDRHVVTYRLIAVFVGALIASLCVVIRRYAIQMGGGMVARLWNTVVAAGIARALSFLVLALMLKWWKAGAQFSEQYFLWIFAGCWLLAALFQREVLPPSKK